MRIREQNERRDAFGLKKVRCHQCHIAAVAVTDNMNLSRGALGLNSAREAGAGVHSRLMGVVAAPAELANFTISSKCPAQLTAEEAPSAPPGIASIGETAPPGVRVRSVNDIEKIGLHSCGNVFVGESLATDYTDGERIKTHFEFPIRVNRG